ncbi:HPr family phosphocarrier protein [Ornithinibacillus gellani]|uniref:HPr family phosphocarrier protein n=1 Tax=Ornithinibacillus gellani TaxID=2293253 RepID=UPI000F476B32|nr:HPr family phosphocarrier protein [Ornithinibacillus gellani]TQS74795.1 HPr family phosphocarrier protein [Ornithinibacillus gellani]
MIEQTVQVKLETGLQAKPAAQFVQLANDYDAHLVLEKDGKRVNAKSIMGLMSLAIGTGESITILAEGNDAERASADLIGFVLGERVFE